MIRCNANHYRNKIVYARANVVSPSSSTHRIMCFNNQKIQTRFTTKTLRTAAAKLLLFGREKSHAMRARTWKLYAWSRAYYARRRSTCMNVLGFCGTCAQRTVCTCVWAPFILVIYQSNGLNVHFRIICCAFGLYSDLASVRPPTRDV